MDVYADLDHLYMLNFSADAQRLAKIVPAPLRVLEKNGRGFPSVVLPCIKRLRPVVSRFPRVDYELFGLRVLVEYDSPKTGTTKGIYFARLIMDPNWVRRVANVVTAFDFGQGQINKEVDPETTSAGGGLGPGHRCKITVRQSGRDVVRAGVEVEHDFPDELTPNSVFADSDEALATYNDISYGFLPDADGRGTKILQIADPHPNYIAWPLVALTVENAWVAALHGDPVFAEAEVTQEPSYFVGRLPRYWRWMPSEKAAKAAAAVPLPRQGSTS